MRTSLLPWLVCAGLLAAPAGEPRADARDLPLVRVDPAPGTDGPLLLLLSGDGDWVDIMSDLAAAAAAAGSPVLGLKSRSYLSEPRKPADAAAALEQAVRGALADWHRSELVIVGYSRGADMAPFVVNRWPADLRARVRGIAFIGLSEYASFEFHFDDLLHEVRRTTDVPTRPELEKLADIALVCVHGEREHDSFCENPVAGMRVATHSGAHRATSDDGSIAVVLRALGIER
ncbi:MAG TPA: AcvB/VirJ family lysyl-phosphatidylglycerol hydrolase [Gammaproteobacteria bacterium]|nr:AcvB/VirJ family lysyl-phosphatidylglycerol hydrolase [Gammaproteobacteria bacterium]